MQLYEIISSEKSSVGKELQSFKIIISKNQIWRPTEDVQFVFLCGANIDTNIPSKRRQILLDFSSRNLPNTKFFLAESIFQILEAEGHKTNLLDIENDLSKFADYVIVILESESAFCELGAFATHKELRKKLIVINDYKHKISESFINLGPLQAISEISDGRNILYYNMDVEGKFYGDGIGDVFAELYKLIYKDPKARRTRVKEYDPNVYFTKDSLRFVHDLIYFTSPISLAELSRVIKKLFTQSKDIQLQKHLGLLCATEQIKRSDNKFYYSLYNKSFFEYGIYDVHNLLASFKNLYYRYDFSRLTWN